jgi:hypothetical protein
MAMTGAERTARHRRKHPEKARADLARARQRAREYAAAIKVVTPCADCGGYFPAVAMDFDHVTGEKEACVGTMVNKGHSVKRVAREIAKCEIVCACCHRVRTAERFAAEGLDLEAVS